MPYTATFSHYHLLRMREMGRVYWCNTVATLGVSLVAIFVPIFLLKSGFTFSDVLVFLLLQQLFAGVLQYPASKLFHYLYPHHMLMLGTLLYAVFFGLLGTLPKYHWPLALLAVVWALNRSTYWTAFHYTFGFARGHTQSGRQVAGFVALALFATTVAPAIGGVIATLFGITYIYIAAIVILVVAVLPMLSAHDGPPRAQLNMSWHEAIAMRRDALANMCNGVILMGEQSMWPLLVYVLVSSYAGVGILSTVIAFSSIAITLYVGRRQGMRGEHHYIKRGIGTYSATNFGRAVVQNSSQVFGLNVLAGIGRSLYITPYMNRYCSNSDGPHRLGYITIMESAFAVGSALFILVLLMLSLLWPMQTVLAISLLFVAICSLGVRLIR